MLLDTPSPPIAAIAHMQIYNEINRRRTAAGVESELAAETDRALDAVAQVQRRRRHMRAAALGGGGDDDGPAEGGDDLGLDALDEVRCILLSLYCNCIVIVLQLLHLRL